MGNTERKEQKSLKIYFRILKYVLPRWKHLVTSMICAILYSIFSGISIYLVIPLLQTLFSGKSVLTAGQMNAGYQGWVENIKTYLNDFLNKYIFTGDQMDGLFKICLILVFGFLLRNFFAYFQSYTMAYVEQGLIKDIRNDLFKHIHSLDISYFSNERAGNLISRVTNDVNVVNVAVSATFLNLVREPISICIYLFIAIAISWKLTIISLVIFPFSLVGVSWVGITIHRESRKLQEKMADITSVLQETIFGARIVKAFGMEKFENQKFQKETNLYFKIILKINRIRNLSTPITEFLGIAAAVIILWYGGSLVLVEKSLNASEFLGFFLIIFQIMAPIKELTTVQTRIQESTAAGKRIFEILDLEPIVQDDINPVILEEFKDSVDFQNVSFAYNGNDQNLLVLKNINLKISKGKIFAIVGPSGAGKSTLIDLVLRFYDPSTGSILIDGLDLKKIELKSLRNKVGVVTQETILFNDTIKNNIAYGLEDFPLPKVMEAAIAANAHKFILEASEGYDTIIGDRGLKLSGGQRQRLSIARALLKNPPIMIFDEATSSLDSESEILVQEAIERLMHNRTSFVIAHRLSTIRNADKIIVIDNGEIVQMGIHEELLNIEGMYKKLYEMQFKL